jgi:hypothetical protein
MPLSPSVGQHVINWSILLMGFLGIAFRQGQILAQNGNVGMTREPLQGEQVHSLAR